MNNKLYWYKIKNIRVIDGDSIEADIDLGKNTWLIKQDIRLNGIDTPECRTRNDLEKKAGFLVKAYVEAFCENEIIIHSIELDKFGRWLADVYSDSANNSLNKIMLAVDIARAYSGGRKESWTEQELTDIIHFLGNEGDK